MSPIDKCKAAVRVAVEELEREAGLPVLSCHMLTYTKEHKQTYPEDRSAAYREITIGLGTHKYLPWFEQEQPRG